MSTPVATLRTRDRRIDFWRGLCLVGMASWHLLTHPSFPRWLAFSVIQPFNFVAEGFVLLAGAAVGLKIASGRFSSARMVRRAGELLVLHYALVLFVVTLAAAEIKFGGTAQRTPLPPDTWAVLSLRYQPYLADILTVFVFLFAAAPLFQLAYSRFGPRAVGLISAVLFATASALPINAHGAFVFNSWQVFFVAGMLFGASADRGMRYLQNASPKAICMWVVAFVTACVVRFALGGRDGTQLSGWQAVLAFNRNPLTIARVIYIGLEMMVIALLTARWWIRIGDSRPVAAVATLGRYSLTVFVSSVVLDYLLKALCSELPIAFPANLVVWALELTVLFAVAGALTVRDERRSAFRVGRSELAVN